jgi:hypothetical protein
LNAKVMDTNNLQNKPAIQATLTGQTAIAVVQDRQAQRLRRQIKPAASIYFDPLFANDD